MSGHHTLVGSSKLRRGGPRTARCYQPTARMYAIAFPASVRIPAVCPLCRCAIEHGGIWFDAGTDTRHSCPQVDRMAAAG